MSEYTELEEMNARAATQNMTWVQFEQSLADLALDADRACDEFTTGPSARGLKGPAWALLSDCREFATEVLLLRARFTVLRRAYEDLRLEHGNLKTDYIKNVHLRPAEERRQKGSGTGNGSMSDTHCDLMAVVDSLRSVLISTDVQWAGLKGRVASVDGCLAGIHKDANAIDQILRPNVED